jgi:preprotein translocase subunit SecE
MKPPISAPTGAKNPLIFLKEVRQELKKVVWPTKKETMKLTAVVIFVSVVVAIFIGILDFIFTNLSGLIIKR